MPDDAKFLPWWVKDPEQLAEYMKMLKDYENAIPKLSVEELEAQIESNKPSYTKDQVSSHGFW